MELLRNPRWSAVGPSRGLVEFRPSLVFPLSAFEGGAIWVEWPFQHEPSSPLRVAFRDVHGRQVKGALLPVHLGPVQFCSNSLLHCTEPFKGRRVVLVAYTVQAWFKSTPKQLTRLEELGFRLPREVHPPPSIPQAPRSTGATSSPVCYEVFAGSAGLTAQFRLAGMRAVAIDWANNKRIQRASPISIDLSIEEGEATFFGMLAEQPPSYIHVAPPCGTASLKAFWLKVPNLGRGGFGTVSVPLY